MLGVLGAIDVDMRSESKGAMQRVALRGDTAKRLKAPQLSGVPHHDLHPVARGLVISKIFCSAVATAERV